MIKKFHLIFTLLFLALEAFSQPIAYMKSGNYSNQYPFKNPSNDESLFASSLYQSKYYVWLQVNQLLTEQQTYALKKTGVELFDYLHDRTYYAAIPSNYNFSQLSSLGVYGIMPIHTGSKLDPSVFSAKITHPWAVERDSLIQVNVTFFSVVNNPTLLVDLANKYMLEGTAKSGYIDGAFIMALSIRQINLISQHPLIQYIEAVEAPPVPEDRQATTNHRTNAVNTTENYPGGLKLTGKFVNVSIGDDGTVDEHIDFRGRIMRNLGSTSSSSTHGDHCAGIMAGAGNLNQEVIGQAPESKIYVYSGYNDFAAFPDLYNIDRVRVTSHSLGQTCNDGYTANARSNDQQVRLYPSLMHVHSAGNSGNTTCGGLNGGWMTITGGFKSGKNVLAVANLSKTDMISTSSSKGPAKDGRIKPDISAVGTSVNSTQPNNTFALNSGTSMACPAIAGSFALLNQAYKNVNGGNEAKSGLLKAIMLNTADDLGNEGPDFTYGWGRVNNRRAVDAIVNGRFFSNTVSQGNVRNHEINVPNGVAQVKVMLYWTDMEGAAGSVRPLVNNLDVVLIAPNLSTNLPWQLYAGVNPTPASCDAWAVKGTDTLNNVEQVSIDNPQAGSYTIRVTGTQVPQGPQEYFVVYEFLYVNEITLTYPFGGETFVPGSSVRIRWDAFEQFGNFTLEYSTNGGLNYTLITNSISGFTRFYDWTIPSTIRTNNLMVRISRNGFSDVNNVPAVCVATPNSISFNPVCVDAVDMSWGSVTGATSYDILRLMDTKMEVIGNTTSTTFRINNTGSSTLWYSVRARIGTSVGSRANAVNYTNTSSVPCNTPVPVTLLSFSAIKRNANVLINWATASEINLKSYIVERSIEPNFSNVYTVATLEPKNVPSANYQIVDDIRAVNFNGTMFYRLKIVEQDGSFKYSKTEKIDLEGNNGILIYPQPAKNKFYVSTATDMPMAKLIITNAIGSSVYSTNINLKANTPVSIDIADLAPGNYYVRIISANNNSLTTHKLVIQ
jgi:hypothetical protein